MKTSSKIILANIFVYIVLAVVYPHLMISPGKLLEGHQKLTKDCFACHTPFLRSSPENCIACHKIDDIGKLSTEGKPIRKTTKSVAFHQKLTEHDCVACHSDHQGVSVYRKIHRFSHKLLPADARKACNSCHDKPDDRLHQSVQLQCDACHSSQRWKPATFEHETYFRKTGIKDCTECHQKPVDSLHSKLEGKCDACHSLEKWKPATFNHEKYFRFDREHETKCVTCHENNDYQRYTCYGCHEHSPRKIRKEHVEEGIYDYEKCTECHRSGDEDEAERIWKSKRGYRGKFKKDHDKHDD